MRKAAEDQFPVLSVNCAIKCFNPVTYNLLKVCLCSWMFGDKHLNKDVNILNTFCFFGQIFTFKQSCLRKSWINWLISCIYYYFFSSISFLPKVYVAVVMRHLLEGWNNLKFECGWCTSEPSGSWVAALFPRLLADVEYHFYLETEF